MSLRKDLQLLIARVEAYAPKFRGVFLPDLIKWDFKEIEKLSAKASREDYKAAEALKIYAITDILDEKSKPQRGNIVHSNQVIARPKTTLNISPTLRAKLNFFESGFKQDTGQKTPSHLPRSKPYQPRKA